MKITKYTQSCVVIEDGGTRVLFDISGMDKDAVSEIGKVDTVLFTHEHGDHFDADIAKDYLNQEIPVYANASTAKLIDGDVNVVEDGQEFSVGSMKFKAFELPHCLMVDGSEGPQNTGYVVNERLFHPGDGDKIDGLSVEVLLVPIAGPDISPKDSCDFIEQLSAKHAIPIHYDMMSAKPDFFIRISQMFNRPFEAHPLARGESVEL